MKTNKAKSEVKEKKADKPKAQTVVAPAEYKGKAMFAIYKSRDIDDETGKPEDGSFAVFQCGMSKAKAILAHVEELKAFVEDNE